MSAPKRFYVPKVGDMTEIDGAEFHHMTAVMRLRVGDEIVLCCGDGSDYRAVIREIGPKTLSAQTLSRSPNAAEPRVDVTLFQAVCKGERMELIVQKANELGVNRIVPFVSRYTTVRPDAHKTARLCRIVAESAKQCGRARIASIGETLDFEAVTREFPNYDAVVFAYEASRDGDLGAAVRGASKIALVVGSEGGFSPEEAACARARGARQVTLGRRVLRAETAAIALTAATMYLAGEW